MSISAARRRRKSEVTSPFNQKFDHGFLFVFDTHYMYMTHRLKVLPDFLIVDYGGM
jgi:hypothetical protein